MGLQVQLLSTDQLVCLKSRVKQKTKSRDLLLASSSFPSTKAASWAASKLFSLFLDPSLDPTFLTLQNGHLTPAPNGRGTLKGATSG